MLNTEAKLSECAIVHCNGFDILIVHAACRCRHDFHQAATPLACPEKPQLVSEIVRMLSRKSGILRNFLTCLSIFSVTSLAGRNSARRRSLLRKHGSALAHFTFRLADLVRCVIKADRRIVSREFGSLLPVKVNGRRLHHPARAGCRCKIFQGHLKIGSFLPREPRNTTESAPFAGGP